MKNELANSPIGSDTTVTPSAIAVFREFLRTCCFRSSIEFGW